jgi:hypothetical protein
MRVLGGLFRETAAVTGGNVVLWAWLKDTQQYQLIWGVMLRDLVFG